MKSRNEFINGLRGALAGKVPANVIEDNVRYYENYIDAGLRQGKSEADILDSLGDPRLLAKTIVEANKRAGADFDSYTSSQEDNYSYGEKKATAASILQKVLQGYAKLPMWLHRVVTVLIVFALLWLVGHILAFLFPVICVVVVVAFVYRLFRRDGFW